MAGTAYTQDLKFDPNAPTPQNFDWGNPNDHNMPGDAGGGGNKGEGTPLKIDKKTETDLLLLQPLDDSTKTLDAKPGIQIFFDYFNLSWPWVLGVCAGLAVLQAMIGGMQMMMSVGSSHDMGKERMTWAIAGLLIIALSGMILTTINPIFYS